MIVRLGVIGGGEFGLMHLRVFNQLEYENKARLIALSDINEKLLSERKKAFKIDGYTDYRRMLTRDDIDAVSIVTPDFLHRQIAIDAINCGKHILVEKPLDVTIEGCDEIIRAARKNNVLLQVDFHKRYDTYHLELEKMVREGRLGQIEYGYAHMEDRIEVPLKWLSSWAAKSSPVWFLGIHMYDLIRWIIKSNGKRVYASGVKKKLKKMGIDTFDSVQAKIEFENGASFTVDTSWIIPEKFESVVNQGIRILGTEGIMEIDSQDRGARGCTSGIGMTTYNSGFFMEEKNENDRTIYHGYGIESIANFAMNVNYLLKGGAIKDIEGKYASGKDGLEATKIALGVHRSIEAGEVVQF
jgi:predicted dehydrogenase